jgi:hypothetical protein
MFNPVLAIFGHMEWLGFRETIAGKSRKRKQRRGKAKHKAIRYLQHTERSQYQTMADFGIRLSRKDNAEASDCCLAFAVFRQDVLHCCVLPT